MNSKHSYPYDVIAFDADDTLWHNETIFSVTHDQYKKLFSHLLDENVIHKKLYETEIQNLKFFGYGVKGFTLSMIETALEITDGKIGADEIREIIGFGKSMLVAPIDLLPDVKPVIETLSQEIPLILITKGDLFDQESKIARSMMADYFTHIEIVSEKNTDSYLKILRKYNIPPERFLMVGNSVSSDILPVLQLGGKAVHIPYHITWQHEIPKEKPTFDFPVLGNISELLDFLKKT